MEAPEKIYIPRLEGNETFVHEWSVTKFQKYFSREVSENVEYMRTDAFIEKALKWYCLDCECNDNCKDTKCFFYRQYERYLKGEKDTIPPKFSNSILNEDGSTSDDWRHRHFIAKMQDAFIEKACKFIREGGMRGDAYIVTEFGEKVFDFVQFAEDFKNYIKGE